ncbi:unnamed protein product [Caenorhabditis angaria]|uniref:Caspase family p20 domain-containing protein n=1 Tax=Caenorhabditis angaria TaxID=860376 RepID=A0A9P1IAH6_9PELO|nr:unnamed protein product [Caenorhabditis angaria]
MIFLTLITSQSHLDAIYLNPNRFSYKRLASIDWDLELANMPNINCKYKYFLELVEDMLLNYCPSFPRRSTDVNIDRRLKRLRKKIRKMGYPNGIKLRNWKRRLLKNEKLNIIKNDFKIANTGNNKLIQKVISRRLRINTDISSLIHEGECVTSEARMAEVFLEIFSKNMRTSDDVKVYGSDPNALQKALDLIQDWSVKWDLPLAPNKTTVLHLGNKNPRVNYYMNGSMIESSKVVRDLGVWVDEKLNFDHHINITVQKALWKTRQLLKAFRFGKLHTYLSLYKTYIAPIIDYGSEVFRPFISKKASLLAEMSLRRYTRSIFRRCNVAFSSYEDRLKQLEYCRELPLLAFIQLAKCLEKHELWLKIVDDQVERSIFSMSQEDIENLEKHVEVGSVLLRTLGNRGQTVMDLLRRLQKLGMYYGDPLFDLPQLVLSRKFKEIRWLSEEQVAVSIVGNVIRLECKAGGFPTPDFKWYDSNSTKNEIAIGKYIDLIRCKCSAEILYKCYASNVVPDGFTFSGEYRKPGKKYRSSLESSWIDVTSFVRDDELCEACRSREFARYEQILKDEDEEDDDTDGLPLPYFQQPSTSKSNATNAPKEIAELLAADKVALIMSNCSYAHLPELVTPHCDAQTLADSLQKMNFKTVTLADLTLDEMRFFIREYRKLLGNGVYAVFYFVGHGFEVNGQCYLLGIDAPQDAEKPEHALSMDWMLSIFRDISPALNLLLLDVCRKFVPFHAIPSFVDYAEQFKRHHRAHRNMVYGYSTSGGVGAYEVKGEVNGVFMKYLKNHVTLNCSVIDMLNKVLNDIGDDKKVCDVQVPEIRTTLTRPRSLQDPLQFDGHTASFDNHTVHWRLMHELPNPVNVRFEDQKLFATIWFQFCGHFTNKVYVLSSISDLPSENEQEIVDLSDHARSHRVILSFPNELQCSEPKEYSDDEEGVSMYSILSGLQKTSGDGELVCCVRLFNLDENTLVTQKMVEIGHVLITRIKCL